MMLKKKWLRISHKLFHEWNGRCPFVFTIKLSYVNSKAPKTPLCKKTHITRRCIPTFLPIPHKNHFPKSLNCFYFCVSRTKIISSNKNSVILTLFWLKNPFNKKIISHKYSPAHKTFTSKWNWHCFVWNSWELRISLWKWCFSFFAAVVLIHFI